MIEHGDVLLTGTTADNLRKLQILQNKGLWCALNIVRDTGVSDLHKKPNFFFLFFFLGGGGGFPLGRYYNKNARQSIIGDVIMPARLWGSHSRRPRNPSTWRALSHLQ